MASAWDDISSVTITSTWVPRFHYAYDEIVSGNAVLGDRIRDVYPTVVIRTQSNPGQNIQVLSPSQNRDLFIPKDGWRDVDSPTFRYTAIDSSFSQGSTLSPVRGRERTFTLPVVEDELDAKENLERVLEHPAPKIVNFNYRNNQAGFPNSRRFIFCRYLGKESRTRRVKGTIVHRYRFVSPWSYLVTPVFYPESSDPDDWQNVLSLHSSTRLATLNTSSFDTSPAPSLLDRLMPTGQCVWGLFTENVIGLGGATSVEVNIRLSRAPGWSGGSYSTVGEMNIPFTVLPSGTDHILICPSTPLFNIHAGNSRSGHTPQQESFAANLQGFLPPLLQPGNRYDLYLDTDFDASWRSFFLWNYQGIDSRWFDF